MDLPVIWQALVSGLLLGGVYALIAAALTLTFGVMRLVNVAHGDFLMAGMYLAFFLTQAGISVYASAIIVVPALFIGGAIVFRLVIQPVAHESSINQILMTVGLLIALQNGALFLFSSDFRTADPPGFAEENLSLLGARVSVAHVIAFAGSIATLGAMYWIVRRTDVGRRMRAAAQDPDAARLCGIDVRRMYMIAFALGIAALGMAAPLVLPLLYVSPLVGALFTVRSFVIVALGGLGSFAGALVGGLVIGVTEGLGAVWLPGSMAPVLGLGVFVLVLMLRPGGLFGVRSA